MTSLPTTGGWCRCPPLSARSYTCARSHTRTHAAGTHKKHMRMRAHGHARAHARALARTSELPGSGHSRQGRGRRCGPGRARPIPKSGASGPRRTREIYGHEKEPDCFQEALFPHCTIPSAGSSGPRAASARARRGSRVLDGFSGPTAGERERGGRRAWGRARRIALRRQRRNAVAHGPHPARRAGRAGRGKRRPCCCAWREARRVAALDSTVRAFQDAETRCGRSGRDITGGRACFHTHWAGVPGADTN